MKKIIMLVVIAIAASSVAFGQMKADKSLETKLIAMETKAWETWKNNDRSFIQSVLSDDAVFVDETGVSDKAQFIKNLYSGGCAVKSYALDNFKFVMLAKDTALMTYKATQDAVCNGKKSPPVQWASSLYIRRSSKWENVFYQTSTVQ
jgi:hypothetical protein